MSGILDHTGTGLGLSASELEGMVVRELPPSAAGTKEIYDLLNEGQNEISRDYGIPKKVLIAMEIPATGRIGLGNQVQSHKNITIADSNGRPYAIYSAQEAASIRPKWMEEKTGGYAVLDLASPSAMVDGELYLRPYVEDISLKYYLSVPVKPLPLTNPDDQPFSVEIEGQRSDGAIPEFHACLAHFALFKIFNRLAVRTESQYKSELYLKQGTMYYAVYRDSRSKIFEYSDPPFIYPKVKR